MITLILCIALFALTIPIRTALLTLRLRQVAMTATGKKRGIVGKLAKGVSKSRSGQTKEEKDSEKRKKAKELAIKALQFMLNNLKLLLNFIRMCLALLSTLFVSGGVFVLILITAVLIAGVSSAGLVTTATTNSSTSSSKSGGSSNSSSTSISVSSAEVKKIIKMKDSEVWNLISDGKFKSYDEANSALKSDKSKWEAFWKGQVKTVKVPCNKWNKSKKKRYKTEVSITVNKHLVDYFTSFMTDLCNAGYVIDTAGGFNVRPKNNDSGSGNYSAHSFGAVLDINEHIDGMGSVPAHADDPKYIGDGHPRKTYKNLGEPEKYLLCTFDSEWLKISKKYKLDWGGYWSASYLDPMHFSLVGDNNKDTRQYKPKTSGV